MSRLNKKQKEKLDMIIGNEKLFTKINELLKQYGAEDLQLVSFRVQPLKENAGSTKALVTKRNFRVFPPLCEHGRPMVERCTEGGSCQWVCNH